MAITKKVPVVHFDSHVSPADDTWPATSWVHYTTSCNTQSSAPEDGQNNFPKHVELTGIINKPLLFASSWLSILFIFHYIFLRLAKQSQFNPYP